MAAGLSRRAHQCTIHAKNLRLKIVLLAILTRHTSSNLPNRCLVNKQGLLTFASTLSSFHGRWDRPDFLLLFASSFPQPPPSPFLSPFKKSCHHNQSRPRCFHNPVVESKSKKKFDTITTITDTKSTSSSFFSCSCLFKSASCCRIFSRSPLFCNFKRFIQASFSATKVQLIPVSLYFPKLRNLPWWAPETGVGSFLHLDLLLHDTLPSHQPSHRQHPL